MNIVSGTVEPSLRLVPAQPEHLPMLEELMNLTIRPWVEVMFERWNPEMARDSIRDDVVNQRASLIVIDEQFAGVLTIRDEPQRLHLEKIYIHPDFQRRGVGTRLLTDLIARAARRPLTLRVLVVNPARALYERLGFVVTETTSEYHFMEHRG
jgi:ribosomal protein S18 acetylase RimI-like enzyme